MDYKTFSIEILKIILSWPTAVVIIILLLRKPITNLIPLLEKLKYKDLEFHFKSELQEIEKVVKETPEISKKSIKEIVDSYENFEFFKTNPRNAVLDSWMNLEYSAKNALKRKGKHIDNYKQVKPSEFVNMLQQTAILDQNKKMIFNKLRELRNEAAHRPDFYIEPSTTSEYISVANTLTSYIDDLE